MKFEVTNTPKSLKKYVKRLDRAFDKYFDNMLEKNWISVNFVPKEKIQELNEEYNKLSHATDVLSFPFVFVDSNNLEEDDELGEVYISEEVVKQNAKELGITFEDELLRVFIHGSLHILGYDHNGTFDDPEPEDLEMFEMQETILKEVIS